MRDDRAQDLAEYGLALAVVGAVAIAAALSIGLHVGSIWDSNDATIQQVVQGNDGDEGKGGHGDHGHQGGGHGDHGDHGHHHGGGNNGSGGGNGG